MAVTHIDVRKAIQRTGLSERAICVYSSLRSFGHVEGGARAVVEGFLAEGCTLVVPTFSGEYQTRPPRGRVIPRNGLSAKGLLSLGGGNTTGFSRDSNVLDADMGAIPRAALSWPGRVRGNHPLNSFTAVGPLARDLIDGQTPMDVYVPLKAVADAGGYVVLMGVGLERMTLVHLAEQVAGRNLFRRWGMVDQGGTTNVVEMRIGGCSEGFGNLDTALVDVERQTQVGASRWSLFPCREAVEAAAQQIRLTPSVTRCSDAECLRCNNAIRGGPILES